MTTNNPLVRAATAKDAAYLYELTNMFTPGGETCFEEFEAHFHILQQDPSWLIAVAIEQNSLIG